MYKYGDGIKQNKSLAKNYLKQSCSQGHKLACDELKI